MINLFFGFFWYPFRQNPHEIHENPILLQYLLVVNCQNLCSCQESCLRLGHGSAFLRDSRARRSYGKSWCCWRYNSNSNWGIHLWRYCHAWHLLIYILSDILIYLQRFIPPTAAAMSKNVENSCLNSPQKNGGTHRRRLSKTSPSFGAADVARSGASSRTAVHVMSHFKSNKCQKAMMFGLYTIQSSNIKLSFFVG